MSETTKPIDDFSLEFISGRLADFRLPEGAFDPASNWDLAYTVYTFASQQPVPSPGAPAGRVKLSRTATCEGEAELTLVYEKDAPGGYRQIVDAAVRCRDDALSTPTRWEYSCRVVDAQGRPFENSVLTKRAEVRSGRVHVVDGDRLRRLAFRGPFTIPWAIWDAVMRLPRQAADPIAFTLLDDFDQVKRHQTLAFRRSRPVTLGKRQEVILHAFDQVGEGIVPWVYWVDRQGRLLFVVSGLEVYVLDPPHAA